MGEAVRFRGKRAQHTRLIGFRVQPEIALEIERRATGLDMTVSEYLRSVAITPQEAA